MNLVLLLRELFSRQNYHLSYKKTIELTIKTKVNYSHNQVNSHVLYNHSPITTTSTPPS